MGEPGSDDRDLWHWRPPPPAHYSREVDESLDSTLSRRIALAAWVCVGAAMLFETWLAEGRLYLVCTSTWALAFAAVSLGFRRLLHAGERSGLALLALQALSVLALVAWWRSSFGGLLLVFVAWQVAHLLRLRAAVAWVAAQSVLLGLATAASLPRGSWIVIVLVCSGLQLFAVLGAQLAERERRGRLALARTNAELQESLRRHAERSSEAERLRLARELHDGLGHQLAALSLAVEAARQQLAVPQPSLLRVSDCVKRSLAELGTIVGALRGATAGPLLPALEELAASIERPRIHLAPAGLDDLAPAVGDTVLRMVQELTTNAIRHSGAENLWLEVAREGDRLRVVARDDGRGARGLVEGFGLRGIRERAVAFDGTVEVASGAGGLRVAVELSLAGREP